MKQADMFHKLMLTSVVSFFPKDVLIPVGIVMAISYLLIILLQRPYYRKGDDRLHGFAQVELFLLMLSGYIFFSGAGYDEATDIAISVFLIVIIVGFIS